MGTKIHVPPPDGPRPPAPPAPPRKADYQITEMEVVGGRLLLGKEGPVMYNHDASKKLDRKGMVSINKERAANGLPPAFVFDGATNCFIRSVVVEPSEILCKHAPEDFVTLKACTVTLLMTGDPTEAIRTGNFRATGMPDWKFPP